jgi:hypothetical protein
VYLLSVLEQPKSGGPPTRGYARDWQPFTLNEKCYVSHRASQTKSIRKRWARHMEPREEENSNFMIFVGNLKKEGTIFIVAPCILKIHLVSHANKCTIYHLLI